MKRKMMCLVMAAVMTVGMGTTVSAEDFQGERSWRVEFNGDGVESNFRSSELAEEIYRIQPGDTIQLQVGIGNTGSGETDWYMTNEIVSTLEEAQASASGGAYEYRLSYTDSEGAVTDLYSSDTVGGDENVNGQEGLHEIAGAPGEYFYLERLKQGESGMVTLWMRVDGETQGNDYQDTLAQLQMNFATEIAQPETVQGEDKVINRTVKEEDKTVYRTQRVKTGDESRILLYSVIALASGLALLGAGIVILKKKKNHEEGELKS